MSAVLRQGSFPMPPPKPPKAQGDDWVSAWDYATNPTLARAYVARRRQDALDLTSGGILVLPYAKVRRGAGDVVIVNEVHCANADCALAYILARWW